MKTNIDFIDYNFTTKDFTDKITLIHSRFGIGKTTLCCKIVSNLSKQDNQNILYVNNDMPSKLIIRKILCDYSNVSLSDLTKVKPNPNKIIDMKGKNSELILKTTKNLDIDYLKNNLSRDLIIIDGFLTKEFFDKLIEFKKEFSGVLIVTSQMNISNDVLQHFDKKFNHILLERNVNEYSISIMTETNVFNSSIVFEPNTLNIRLK
jgi:molybdopterin-guanine dinucleotide biosynthesis protein